MRHVQALVDPELSEPYSIFTYRSTRRLTFQSRCTVARRRHRPPHILESAVLMLAVTGYVPLAPDCFTESICKAIQTAVCGRCVMATFRCARYRQITWFCATCR